MSNTTILSLIKPGLPTHYYGSAAAILKAPATVLRDWAGVDAGAAVTVTDINLESYVITAKTVDGVTVLFPAHYLGTDAPAKPDVAELRKGFDHTRSTLDAPHVQDPALIAELRRKSDAADARYHESGSEDHYNAWVRAEDKLNEAIHGKKEVAP